MGWSTLCLGISPISYGGPHAPMPHADSSWSLYNVTNNSITSATSTTRLQASVHELTKSKPRCPWAIPAFPPHRPRCETIRKARFVVSVRWKYTLDNQEQQHRGHRNGRFRDEAYLALERNMVRILAAEPCRQLRTRRLGTFFADPKGTSPRFSNVRLGLNTPSCSIKSCFDSRLAKLLPQSHAHHMHLPESLTGHFGRSWSHAMQVFRYCHLLSALGAGHLGPPHRSWHSTSSVD